LFCTTKNVIPGTLKKRSKELVVSMELESLGSKENTKN